MKKLKFNFEYNILAICFSIVTLYLISLTLPLAQVNINEYMENTRTLLLAIGAGFFGLLGFIVGGFAISSGKMPDTFKNLLTMWNVDESLEHKNHKLQIFINANKIYRDINTAFQSTVSIIIFNIIATFISFIITLIPKEFNEILFWLCISLIVISFYLAIFYTLSLFKLGMKPISIDLINNQSDIQGLLNDYQFELEMEKLSPELVEGIMNDYKNKRKNKI